MNRLSPKTNLLQALRSFHEDERGMEAMQVVIIVAIAALVLGAAYKYVWPKVYKQAASNVDGMSTYQPSDPSKLGN